MAFVAFAALRDTPERRINSGDTVTWSRLGADLSDAWRHPGTRLGLWTHFTTQFTGTVFALMWGFPFLIAAPGSQVSDDQVAERRVTVLVNRGVEADVVTAPGDEVDHSLDLHAELLRDLSRVGLVAQLALEVATSGTHLVELLHDVHGEPHDTALLGDAAGDGLTDPPGGVGGELEALAVVELLDRPDQAGVALLDQVEHRHLRAAVLARDRHDQTQVGGDELVEGALALGDHPLELLLGRRLRGSALLAAHATLGQEVLGKESGFDGLAQLDLTGGIEQRGTRDLVEVHTDAVSSLGALTHLSRCCRHADQLLHFVLGSIHHNAISRRSIPSRTGKDERSVLKVPVSGVS